MKLPQLLFATLLITLFSACTKNDNENLVAEIELKMTIPSEYRFIHTQGLLYEGSYLVWGSDESNNLWLVSYDIESQAKQWEMDFSGITGSGQPMQLYGDYLIVEELEAGVTVVNLLDKEIVFTYRYDMVPDYTSLSPLTIHKDKIYNAVYNTSEGSSSIISLDIKSGTVQTEFEWPNDTESNHILHAPFVFEEESGKVNFLMLLRQEVSATSFAFDVQSFLVSANIDHSINWIDTLSIHNQFVLEPRPLVAIGSDLFLLHKGVISYDMKSGNRNWSREGSEIVDDPTLFVREGELYFNSGYRESGFLKLDKSTGETIWGQYDLPGPSSEFGFVASENELLYVNGFSNLILLDKFTGKYYNVDHSALRFMASPVVYNNEEEYLTHTADNQIIRFKIKE